VDEVRSAGVDQLGLLTDRIEGQQQRTMAAPATFQ